MEYRKSMVNKSTAQIAVIQQRHEKLSEIFLATLAYPLEKQAEFISLACGDDLSLRDEIKSMLAAHQCAEVFLDKPLLVSEQSLDAIISSNNQLENFVGRRLGKYNLVREINRGGMGVIYEAIRNDLVDAKAVAIKILRPELYNEITLARFRIEYQILASLDHPYIARLIDIDSTETGTPYLVMELINGQPIDDYCRLYQLSIRERLKLFCKVCQAVQYAHTNLVIHRDLKPSNILITTDGIPKLLDFGIAKNLKKEGNKEEIKLTQTGLGIMTPAYASPEQILQAKLTVTTDIYSLGVLLYQLLTGHMPYELYNHPPQEIARIICEQLPIKPSVKIKTIENSNELICQDEFLLKDIKKLAKQLTMDLDNIVLMALRKEPERRYRSVEQFSQDILYHLDGFPIIACNDSFSYRANKYIKRNWIILSALVLIILSITSGLIGTLWQATRAEQERARVEAQRQLLQARAKDLRNLTNALLFKYNDRLEQIAGATSLREEMINEALSYLDQLAQQSAEDKELQHELAQAYQKVGDIQGRPFRTNIGNTEAALVSYIKSLGIYQKLAYADVNDSHLQNELAIAWERTGEIFQRQGNINEALDAYEKTQAICEKLMAINSNNKENHLLLADCYIRTGDVWRSKGNFSNVFERYSKAINIYKLLLATDPNNAKSKRGLAAIYTRLINIFESNYDLVNERMADSSLSVLLNQQSLFFNRLIVDDAKNALKLDPENPFLQSELAGCYLLNSSALLKSGNIEEALMLSQNALMILSRLVDNDPLNSEPRFRLAVAYAKIAEAQLKLKDLTKARIAYEKSLSTFQQLITTDTNNTLFKSYLAHTYEQSALLSITLNMKHKAAEQLRASLEIWQTLITTHSTNVSFKIDFLRCLNQSSKVALTPQNNSTTFNLINKFLLDYQLKIKERQLSDLELAEYGWFLLTCEPPFLRDEKLAIEMADTAYEISESKNLSVLLTVAAIYSTTKNNKTIKFNQLSQTIEKIITSTSVLLSQQKPGKEKVQ